MPRVPVWNGGVSSAALPTPMVRPADSGLADLGRSLQQAGGEAFKVAEDARQKAEAIQINDVAAKQEAWWLERFHDDERGFKRLKGEAAFGGEKALFEEYEKERQTWLAGVGSERARAVADANTRARMLDHRGQAEGFLGQQRDVAAGASLVARKATTLDSLALHYADPEERARLVTHTEGAIRALSVSKEAAEADVAAWRKETDALVIRRFLDEKDAAGAKAYFAQARDRLGKDAARIGREIDAVGFDTEAEDRAVAFVEQATGENGRVRRDTAEAALDGIEDTKLRDEVRKRLEHRLSLSDRAWGRKIAEQVNLAIVQYEKGGNSLGAIDPRIKEWFLDEENGAAAEWQSLEAMAQRDADRWRTLQQRKKGDAASDASDADALVALRIDIEERPEVYAEMSEEEFRAEWRKQLSDKSYKAAGTALASHKRRMAAGQLANMTEFRNSITGEIEWQGITSKKAQQDLRGAMARWLDQYLVGSKQQWPTQEQIRNELERQIVDVKVRGRLWDTKKPRYRTDADDEIVGETRAEQPRLSEGERMDQLILEGRSDDEIAAILAEEF